MRPKPCRICCPISICRCFKNKEDPNGIHNEYKLKEPRAITKQPVLTISGNLKTFEENCLEEHNRLRALHGCPSLRLNRGLSAYASEWAEMLADRNMLLEYRSEAKFGENLFVAREYNADAHVVVKSWYDEIWLYDFSKPGYTSGTDHFTQVVWRATTQMGVGIKTREGNTWIVVNYEPMGNIPDQFGLNVPKLLK